MQKIKFHLPQSTGNANKGYATAEEWEKRLKETYDSENVERVEPPYHESANSTIEGSEKLPTKSDMDRAINECSRMQKSLAQSKTQAAKFNTGTVVYDAQIRQYYYGMNRGGQISGDTLNPDLKSLLPSHSLNNYRLGNCAEVDAINQALNNGASLKNLYVYTVDVNTGTAKMACENCTYTFGGKVADIISGVLGGN